MSDDLIKRSDAIKAIAQDLMYESCVQSEYASDELSDWIEVAKVILEDVPSADRPQGEWTKDEDGTYRCSNCGGCEEQYIYGTENWYGCGESKFCPSCGARMKGADDE